MREEKKFVAARLKKLKRVKVGNRDFGKIGSKFFSVESNPKNKKRPIKKKGNYFKTERRDSQASKTVDVVAAITINLSVGVDKLGMTSAEEQL